MPILYRGKLKIQSCSLFANLLNPCSSFQSLFIARSIQYAGLLLSGTLGNPHPDDIFTCLTAKQALIFRTFRDEPFYPLISFKTKDASTTIGQRLSSNVFDLEVAFLLPLSLARIFKKIRNRLLLHFVGNIFRKSLCRSHPSGTYEVECLHFRKPYFHRS